MEKVVKQRVTVWYDGACPLCVREIAAMRKLDGKGRIDFVDVAEGSNAEISCPIDRSELLARFHARDKEGKTHSGAAAFAVMWRTIPLLKPLGYVARIPLFLSALEALYVQFLKIRPSLQRWMRKRAQS